MIRTIAGLILMLSLPACQNQEAVEAATPSPSQALLARAAALELDTEYVPPPGQALDHHTAGFAKVLCSALFVSGLEPDFAVENIGYFTSPYQERAKVTKRRIDYENKAVHLTLPSGITRTAKYYGDQGCVALPIGKDSVHFTPVEVESALADAGPPGLFGCRSHERSCQKVLSSRTLIRL